MKLGIEKGEHMAIWATNYAGMADHSVFYRKNGGCSRDGEYQLSNHMSSSIF